MNTFQKLQALITPSRRREALALLVLMLIGMALETLGLGLVIPALAFMTDPGFTSKHQSLYPLLDMLGNPSQVKLITLGLLLLVAVYTIRTLFLTFLSWRQASFTFGVQENLSQRLFTGYLQQPYTFHLQRNSAQLIRNVVNETNQFTLGALIPGMALLTEMLVLLGIAILLLCVEPLGTILVVIILGVTSYTFHSSTKTRILHWGEARQLHDGLRIQHLQQGLGGAKDVKLLGREDDFLSQYAVHNAGSARMGERQTILAALPRLWLELLAVIGLAVLVFIMLAQGKSMTSLIPVLGLFAAAAFRLLPSVNRVLNTIQCLRYSLPVINVLYSELQQFTGQSVAHQHVSLPFNRKLQLHDTSYTYPGAPAPVLTHINLTIHKGTSVGFVGGSGTGKTTLIDIILGLLTPTHGKITVDGIDIQLNIRGWQDQIGYVPQSIYLTDDTLRRNVAFGLAPDQIDEEAVQRAIKAAQLDEFVSALPDGLDTLVGERGVRLSGGQCQRIGIARALYHDPPVLVLDEASSALDAETEQDIMQAIRSLKGKTILIVAHRLSTVEHCDTIVRLEQGKISEQGVPQKMLVMRNWIQNTPA